MKTRLTKKFVIAAFEKFAIETGLSTITGYKDDEGYWVSRVGSVYLSYNPVYGGYQIEQLQNRGGAISVLSGHRRKASEMVAWMEGVIAAKHHQLIPLMGLTARTF